MKRWIAFLMVTGLAACSSAPIKLDSVKTERRLKAYDAVDVYTDVEDTRTDPIIGANLRTKDFGKIETGAIWRRAFIGKPDSEAKFSVLKAELQWRVEAAGFVSRYTYVIDGEVKSGSMTRPIHAEGSRATGGFDPRGAMKQAIELGVLDAAQQAKIILQSAKGE